MNKYLCQEDTETFIVKAKDLKQAQEYAQLWSAVVIREVTVIKKHSNGSIDFK